MNISRKQAKELGLIRYYTGKPCKHGHVAERHIISGNCMACFRLRRNKKSVINTKRWRRKHKDLKREQERRHRERNPILFQAIYSRRRARMKNAEGRFEVADIVKLFKKQQGKCANPTCRCDIRLKYQIDHKMPLSRGGSNWPRNLQLLCAICNARKGARTMKEWLNAEP